ncbi:uncharacterized protein LOC132728594 isoform X2 [Ruditapes philippinarum]|uniref:uncharacterized protein LOC132728594 isoform X1 n=1 Tax=Ruditapes philippinarum TaxID=129788 RepID=UPI00295B619D|nr:uncharacterized protein LOC132728594 isoform X1 [Ruditapes philippinarum]XP_060570243.1 uncharacterized protein LOC132728594 isoform X2 [Ruditapes philippinarum]
MASTNKDLTECVETDNASLLYIREDETRESVRNIACFEKTYKVCFPPERSQVQSTLNCISSQNQGFELYQCSQNLNDQGSGSDSAEEEHNPYGSPEAIAPSGKPKAKNSIRRRPDCDYNAMAAYTGQKRPVIMANENIRQQGSGPYVNEETCIEGTLALSGSSIQKSSIRGEDKFEDVNMRLATFFDKRVDWPHTNPTAEMMASAGLIFKGVYTVNGTTVNDMVECYKCGGRLYGFTEADDPAEEHRTHYPSCK